MLRSVTDPAFLRWGSPVSAEGDAPCGETLPLSGGGELSLLRFGDDTIWDHGEGMTVLLIAEGETLHRFYLDRAVRLRGGVRFGFAPLEGSSSVRHQAGLTPERAECQRVPAPVFAAALQPMQIFTCLAQRAEGGFYFPGEQHQPMELLWLQKGTLHNYCGGEDQLLRARELLLIPSGQWHIQYADETVQFLTLAFLWEGQGLEALAGRPLKPGAEAERDLALLEQELQHEHSSRDEALHAALKLLLIHLRRQSSEPREPRRASPGAAQLQRQLVDKAMQTVSARIHERLSVPELAAAVNVSQTHLTNLFQRYLGVSPAKYITRIRVEECKALLSRGDRSVGEIAESMGYSSIPHFCKQFRQWTGLSPAAFARQRQEESGD